jgi:hypothetical protein
MPNTLECISGKQVVGTPGTATLITFTPPTGVRQVSQIILQADINNEGTIAVGGSNAFAATLAAPGTGKNVGIGVQLAAGKSVAFYNLDVVSGIYFDGDNTTDVITYTAIF